MGFGGWEQTATSGAFGDPDKYSQVASNDPYDSSKLPPPPPGYEYGVEEDEYGYRSTSLFRIPEGEGGASSRAAELNHALGLKQLEVDWARVGIDRDQQLESSRANKAGEAAAARQRALDAAGNALSSYLEGSRLADARRLAMFEESRQLLPYLVNPEQKYQAGLEPEGALSQAAARSGLSVTPQRLPTKQFNPQALGETPGPQQIGAGVMDYISKLEGAGNRPA